MKIKNICYNLTSIHYDIEYKSRSYKEISIIFIYRKCLNNIVISKFSVFPFESSLLVPNTTIKHYNIKRWA